MHRYLQIPAKTVMGFENTCNHANTIVSGFLHSQFEKNLNFS